MPQPMAPIAPIAPQQPVAPQIPGDNGLMGMNGGNPLPASGSSVQPIEVWPSWSQVAPQQNTPAAPAMPTAFGPMAGAPQYAPPQQQFQQPAPQQFAQAPQYQQPQQFAAPPQQYLQGMPPPPAWQAAQVTSQMLAGPFGGSNPAAGGGAAPVSQPPQAPVGMPVGQPAAGLGAAGPPPSTALRDSLIAQGVNANQYTSDEQLIADLGESLQEIENLRYYARFGRDAVARERALGSPIPGNGAAAPSQAQPSQSAPGSPASAPRPTGEPEWRPEWDQLVRRDPQSGRFVAVDPTAVNPAVVERANERAAWLHTRGQKLLQDPLSFLREAGLDQMFQEERQRAISEFQQRQQAEQAQAEQTRAVEAFVQQNATTLFQQDARGQTLINQATGQPVLTTRGQAFNQFVSEYSQQFQQRYGREPDARDALSQAQMRLQFEESQGRFGAPLQQPPPQVYAQQQQQPGQPSLFPTTPAWPAAQPAPQQPAVPSPGNNVQRALAMNGAAWDPNRQGTQFGATPQVPQNPYDRNFGRMLRQAGAQAGVIPYSEA